MSVSKPCLAVLAAALLLALGIGSADARPISPSEEKDQPYSGIVPACENQGSLSVIQSRFAQRESEYWHSGLEIAAFQEVREVGFRSNGLDYIPRRYCQAHALMSDQKIRTVDYSLVEAGGGIGFETGVIFCVVGLDRNDAFAPGCKMALP